ADRDRALRRRDAERYGDRDDHAAGDARAARAGGDVRQRRRRHRRQDGVLRARRDRAHATAEPVERALLTRGATRTVSTVGTAATPLDRWNPLTPLAASTFLVLFAFVGPQPWSALAALVAALLL